MTDIQKVAFATDDGSNINRHFGHLRGYVVVTVTDGLPTQRGLLPRPGDSDNPGGGHNHGALLAPIADCNVLIAGGMGLPMARHVAAQGLGLVLTSLTTIDEALDKYLAGSLDHEADRAHEPRH
jgi:predicted Fe-Mo cluster-binding NifX family protein